MACSWLMTRSTSSDICASWVSHEGSVSALSGGIAHAVGSTGGVSKDATWPCAEISFIGSTSLAVCQKARIHQHLVFVGYTAHGKTSIGWSFGCLLRLVASNQGEVLTFCLTSCNIDDRHLVPKLAKEFVSKLNGDKCYLSLPLAPTASGHQRARSHHVRFPKMHNRLLDWSNKVLLCLNAPSPGPSLISSKAVEKLSIPHRNPINFLVNLIAGLIAYVLQSKKPSLGLRLPSLVEA